MSQTLEQQFTEGYKANTDALFRHILFRIGGDREKAKDLLQETFTRAWSALIKREQGEEIENLRAYFYRIAHNLIIDEYGKPKLTSLDALAEGSESGEYDVPDAKTVSPLASAESTELMRAMNKLPADFREVLTMRYIDDLGPNQIAELTGESANVISVRINRATAALRKVLNIE